MRSREWECGVYGGVRLDERDVRGINGDGVWVKQEEKQRKVVNIWVRWWTGQYIQVGYISRATPQPHHFHIQVESVPVSSIYM